MTTLAEIEKAVDARPMAEQQALARYLNAKFAKYPRNAAHIPPPDLPIEELKRIHAIIEEEFSRLDGTC